MEVMDIMYTLLGVGVISFFLQRDMVQYMCYHSFSILAPPLTFFSGHMHRGSWVTILGTRSVTTKCLAKRSARTRQELLQIPSTILTPNPMKRSCMPILRRKAPFTWRVLAPSAARDGFHSEF